MLTAVETIDSPAVPRFTLDGSAELEARLDRICRRVRSSICLAIPRPLLRSIVLGGGYGRGEGGVFRDLSGDRPYNDLEFYVVMRGDARLHQAWLGPRLRPIAHRISEEEKIEVEFKLISRRTLEKSAPSMFYYDLVFGHRLICGDADSLNGLPRQCNPGALPLFEATRLLMNRCTGLLFTEEKFRRGDHSPGALDFIVRNLYKARLGFGDAFLAAHGRYHWSCRERRRRLEEWGGSSGWLADLQAQHSRGVEFKLHPDIGLREANLAADLEELKALGCHLWLWLESRRLNTPFRRVDEYIEHPANKCSEVPALRSALVRMRAFGPVGAARNFSIYPRHHVLNALALLLWEPRALEPGPHRIRLQQELAAPVETFIDAVDSYRQIWSRVN